MFQSILFRRPNSNRSLSVSVSLKPSRKLNNKSIEHNQQPNQEALWITLMSETTCHKRITSLKLRKFLKHKFWPVSRKLIPTKFTNHTVYVAVPDNRILFCHVFRAHHWVWHAIALTRGGAHTRFMDASCQIFMHLHSASNSVMCSKYAWHLKNDY